MPAAEGRLVLITGAASGIGRVTAQAFVRRGDRVLGADLNGDNLETVSGELGGPPSFVPFRVDVTDLASVEAMAGEVLDRHGVPDVVVACAGIGLDALFTETSEAALRAVFDVNTFGVVRSIKPFVSGMVERSSGRILIVSSLVGKRGTPYYSAYSASKFALHGLADALRCELVGTGVSVGLICPGSAATDFDRHKLREGPGQKRVRPGQLAPEQVAQTILRMADSRRAELVFPLQAKLLCTLDAIAPRLVDRLLARILRGDDSKS